MLFLRLTMPVLKYFEFQNNTMELCWSVARLTVNSVIRSPWPNHFLFFFPHLIVLKFDLVIFTFSGCPHSFAGTFLDLLGFFLPQLGTFWGLVPRFTAARVKNTFFIRKLGNYSNLLGKTFLCWILVVIWWWWSNEIVIHSLISNM